MGFEVVIPKDLSTVTKSFIDKYHECMNKELKEALIHALACGQSTVILRFHNDILSVNCLTHEVYRASL